MAWYLWRVVAFLLALACALAPPDAHGASASATLIVQVADPAGALLTSATVTLRNQGTGAKLAAVPLSGDVWRWDFLSPGDYAVEASAPGFRTVVRPDVKLHVDQVARLRLTLPVGAATETVNVSSAAPLLETDSATRGQVVDHGFADALPLDERNFLAFTLLSPGVQSNVEGSQLSGQGGAISVNGAREQSNNFLLEGTDDNDSLINQFSVLPSVEAIEEFKLQSANSSAEYGRSGGAQINVVLRSGSDHWHGSGFGFSRNRYLDAKNFFDLPDCTAGMAPGTCTSIPRFDRSQYGGSLGGPLRRDRTFFFAAYEGLNLRQASTRVATVPSQVQRAAALAAIPPAFRNPAGVAVFDLLPAANVGFDLAASNNFVSAPILRDLAHQFAIKVDHILGRRDTLSAHYALYDDGRFNPFDPLFGFTNLPGYGSNWADRGQHAGVTWRHTGSSGTANELRIAFNRRTATILQQSAGIDRNRQLGFPSVLTAPQDLGFPVVLIAGFDGIGEPRTLPQGRQDNLFDIADNFAWSPAWQGGRHRLKFGGEWRRQSYGLFVDAVARGQWAFLGLTGDPLRDLLLGFPAFALAVKGDSNTDLRSDGLSFYVQDDWRLKNRLNVNLGLRWEYNRPPVDSLNRLSVPDLSAASAACSPAPACQFIPAGTAGAPRATFRDDRNNFAPRVGLAWQPLRSDRFVVHAAYGIFYDAGLVNSSFFPRVNPPFYDIGVFINNGTNTIQDIISQPAAPVPPIATRIDPNLRDSYLQAWNLDLQFRLPKEVVFDVGYVGTKGTKLTTERNPNQSTPPAGVPPFPQFGPINLIENSASSSYEALQARATKRFEKGPSFIGAYTFSRSIDNASAEFATGVEPGFWQDAFNARAERGLSSFHAAHRFVLSYVYELPFGGGRRWLDRPGALSALARGWQVSGITTLQSGRPFTVNRGIDQSHSGTATLGIFADRPNQVSDPNVAGPVPANPDPLCQMTISQGGLAADHVHTPQSWFNPCAFADPGVAFGNAGRNSLIGPGLEEFSIALRRDIALGEHGHLQLRAELFNVLNHPNFDTPDRNFDSRTFGELRSANENGNAPPRQVQLGIRVSF